MGHPSKGPGWERLSQATLIHLGVDEGLVPESVLLPVLAPAHFSNPDLGDFHFASYPIGGPGWEHDILPISVPEVDHICNAEDPLCTFPQRGLPTQNDPLGCGMHACRSQDPWCQSGHLGFCPHNSDRRRQVPIIDCWCPQCQSAVGPEVPLP